MPLPNGNLLVFGEEVDPADIDRHPFFTTRNRVGVAKGQIETILSELSPTEIAELREELREKELFDWLEIMTVH